MPRVGLPFLATGLGPAPISQGRIMADKPDAKAEEKEIHRLEKELKHAEKEQHKAEKSEHHAVSVSCAFACPSLCWR